MRREDAPDPVSDIVRHQERPIAVNRYAYSPAERLLLLSVEETGQDIDGRSGRTASAILDDVRCKQAALRLAQGKD